MYILLYKYLFEGCYLERENSQKLNTCEKYQLYSICLDTGPGWIFGDNMIIQLIVFSRPE